MDISKLDSGIVDSSIWMLPHDVLRVWIALIAKADKETGVVRIATPALAHLCMIDVERTKEILGILASKDVYSRTPDNDGRRIEFVNGDIRLLNHEKYNCNKLSQNSGSVSNHFADVVSTTKSNTCDVSFGENNDNLTSQTITSGNSVADVLLPTTSTTCDSISGGSGNSSADSNEETGDFSSENCDNIKALKALNALSTNTLDTYKNLEKETKEKKLEQKKENKEKPDGNITFATFEKQCKQLDESLLPQDHSVFRFAENTGLDVDHLRIAWMEFKRDHTTGKGSNKKQRGIIGWRKTFDNYVRKNYYRLWFTNRDGQVQLTSAGEMLKREFDSITKKT